MVLQVETDAYVGYQGTAAEEDPRPGDPRRGVPARGRPDRRDEGGQDLGAGDVQGAPRARGRVLEVPCPIPRR